MSATSSGPATEGTAPPMGRRGFGLRPTEGQLVEVDDNRVKDPPVPFVGDPATAYESLRRRGIISENPTPELLDRLRYKGMLPPETAEERLAHIVGPTDSSPLGQVRREVERLGIPTPTLDAADAEVEAAEQAVEAAHEALDAAQGALQTAVAEGADNATLGRLQTRRDDAARSVERAELRVDHLREELQKAAAMDLRRFRDELVVEGRDRPVAQELLDELEAHRARIEELEAEIDAHIGDRHARERARQVHALLCDLVEIDELRRPPCPE